MIVSWRSVKVCWRTKSILIWTETHIVSNVKNVEFQSCIVIHQQVNEEYETVDHETIPYEQFTKEYEKIKNDKNGNRKKA